MADSHKNPEAWHACQRKLGRVLLRPRIFALSFDPELRGKTREGVHFMLESVGATIYLSSAWLMFGLAHLGDEESLCRAVALRREIQSIFGDRIGVELKATHYVVPRYLPMPQEPWRHLDTDDLRSAITAIPLSTIDPGGSEPLPEAKIEEVLRAFARSNSGPKQLLQ